MQIKIIGNKKIEFTDKGVAYVLDCLAARPFSEVNGLINDILLQIKAQEGDANGPRSVETTTSRRDTSVGDCGVAAVEGFSSNN